MNILFDFYCLCESKKDGAIIVYGMVPQNLRFETVRKKRVRFWFPRTLPFSCAVTNHEFYGSLSWRDFTFHNIWFLFSSCRNSRFVVDDQNTRNNINHFRSIWGGIRPVSLLTTSPAFSSQSWKALLIQIWTPKTSLWRDSLLSALTVGRWANEKWSRSNLAATRTSSVSTWKWATVRPSS